MLFCDHCNHPSTTVKYWNAESKLCEVCTQYLIELSAKNHRERQGFKEEPMEPYAQWVIGYKERLEKWLDDERQRVSELQEKIKEMQKHLPKQ